MKWSWKLGEFAGIGVYMHATFVLLIGWVALSHWVRDHTLASSLAGVGFTMSLFIGGLAFLKFGVNYSNEIKIGVLMGSLLSGVLGYSILRFRYYEKKIGVK